MPPDAANPLNLPPELWALITAGKSRVDQALSGLKPAERDLLASLGRAVAQRIVEHVAKPRPRRATQVRDPSHPAGTDAHLQFALDLALLKLEPGATLEQIKSAYRQRAKELHPDKGGSNEAMAELTAAYRRLIARFNSEH